MARYEYKCRECNHFFEAQQKMSDPAITTCPTCGKEHAVDKIFSTAAVHFKGRGWYTNSYGKGKNPSNLAKTK